MNVSAPSARFPLLAAGCFGLTGVALGALGAHALAEPLAARGMAHAWETGAKYQLYHTLAILGAAIWLQLGAGRAAKTLAWSVRLWSTGIVLFSGSLYGLALGGPRWLGPITPLGGIALMAGWAGILAAAFARRD